MPNVATQTVEMVNWYVKKDQGAKYRSLLKTVLPHIGDAYSSDEETFRSHLGASILGKDCARAIYYDFRWFTRPEFDGRIIRLFNRGHIEEGRIIAALLMIGVQVYQQDEEGNQFRISFAGGHAGGSGDGIGVGIPDLMEGARALLEFKTHNDKSFMTLKANGVKDAKYEHFVQSNLYMRGMELPVTLYIGVNKNTDEWYAELIGLDVETADKFLHRGEKIVFATEPPAKINESPGYWKCRFCDHKPVCHLGATPAFNCRSCRASEAKPDGTWYCKQRDIVLTKEIQKEGCPQYVSQ